MPSSAPMMLRMSKRLAFGFAVLFSLMRPAS